MFRIFFYITFIVFLVFAVIFWMYTDEFFNWLYGYHVGSEAENAVLARTDDLRSIFSWSAALISLICFVISIIAIRMKIKGRVVAYLSLLMSGITIMIFIISFFGHGIVPTRGIL